MSCRMYEFFWCANNSTVLFAFCSSELYGDIQCSGTLSKVEKTVNKRLHGLQLCRSKAVGRGREDDVEPSDSRRSAQPDAKFVMSQKHWLMFTFLAKKLLYFYQKSYGAATPRHLVHSINKYGIILHECVFFVTCLKWHVGITVLGHPIALVQWQIVSKWLPSTSKACSLCLRAAAVLQ